jgi:hypothetical protein
MLFTPFACPNGTFSLLCGCQQNFAGGLLWLDDWTFKQTGFMVEETDLHGKANSTTGLTIVC